MQGTVWIIWDIHTLYTVEMIWIPIPTPFHLAVQHYVSQYEYVLKTNEFVKELREM